MNFSIKLQDTTYDGVFNLNVVRNFCRVKNYATVDEYLVRIGTINFEKLSFDDLDDLMQLVVLAVEEQARQDRNNVVIDIDDIYAQGIESIAGALNALANSLPQADEGAPSGNAQEAASQPAGTASKK